jgi:hypothetical protein
LDGEVLFLLAAAWLAAASLCGLAAASLCDFLFSNRLPGGGVTFFAAAKKVTKESSFLQPDTAA